MTMGLPPMRAARIVLQERIAVFTMDRDDVRNELTGSGLADDICDAIQWANQNLEFCHDHHGANCFRRQYQRYADSVSF